MQDRDERRSRWLPVKPGEGAMLASMALFAFLSVAIAIVVRTWADTAFLDRFAVGWLPLFFIVSAIFFAPATLAYAWLARRFRPVPLHTGMLLFFALLVVAATFVGHGRAETFVTVLVLTVVSPLVNVICWNTLLERMDSRQARRLIPIVGGFATAGAIGGGALCEPVILHSGPDALLWAVVLLILAAAALPRFVAGTWRVGEEALAEAQPSFREGLAALGRNDLLRVVGLATFLMAVTTNLVDFQFKAHVQAEMDAASMGIFFARFHSVTNLCVLFVQFLVVGRLVERFGIGFTYTLHPGLLLAGTLGCLFLPGLAMATAARGLDTMLKFTVQNAAQNMAVTPVPFLERTQAKVFLKGMIYPLGGFAAGLLLPLARLYGGDRGLGVPIATALLATAWFFAARRVRARYRKQLERNLEVEVRPGLTAQPTSPDVVRAGLRTLIEMIHALRRETGRRERGDRRAIHLHLEELFSATGLLVGDTEAVRDAARRYFEGTPNERSDAIELLDTWLREQEVGGAGELLEQLAEGRWLSEQLSGVYTSPDAAPRPLPSPDGVR